MNDGEFTASSRGSLELLRDHKLYGQWRWNRAANTVKLSDVIVRNLGLISNVFQTEDLLKIVHPDNQNEIFLKVRDALQNRIPLDAYIKLNIDNGHIKWSHLISEEIPEAIDREVSGVLIILFDQDEIKKLCKLRTGSAEHFCRYGLSKGNGHRSDYYGPGLPAFIGKMLYFNQDRRLAKKYETFFHAIEHSTNAVIITDNGGEITYCNPAFLKLYGYSPEEVLNQNPRLLNPGIKAYRDEGITDLEYHSIFATMWSDIKNPDKGYWDGEILNITKAGKMIRVHLYINAVFDRNGCISSFIGYPIDVTGQYRKEMRTRIQTIMTIAELAEKRDNDTGHHMKRIGEYAYIIAKKLDLPAKFCDDIRVFAPLHDIGKVGISDRILLARRKLSDEEFEVMKSHTLIGYNILKEKSVLTMAAEIAVNHHEKYDGSGYPNGLKGEEIPLSAMITSIADVYDALRSRRPYKKPLSAIETMSIIRKDSGKHFAPNLVQIIEESREELNYIFESMND